MGKFWAMTIPMQSKWEHLMPILVCYNHLLDDLVDVLICSFNNPNVSKLSTNNNNLNVNKINTNNNRVTDLLINRDRG